MANHIIFVHGRNPKPPHEDHRAQLWRCLLHGVAVQQPDVAMEMQKSSQNFDLVSWSHLFYSEQKNIQDDLPWIDRMLNKSGPDQDDLARVHSWRVRIDRLLYEIVDRFYWLVDLVPDPTIRHALTDIRRYTRNDLAVASRIRNLLKFKLIPLMERNHRILVIGHSMGSIIAYDTFWELWHEDGYCEPIDGFLSIGSPLGTRHVQKTLLGSGKPESQRFFGNIGWWHNMSSTGDLIAVDTTVEDDFREMVKLHQIKHITDQCSGIYNYFRNEAGLNVHRSYGYMANPLVAGVIARWWRGDEFPGRMKDDKTNC